MDSGFYAACTGLRSQSQALEVVAHNLANLNTAGFHGEQVTFQSLIAVSNSLPASTQNLVLSNVRGNVLNTATNDYGVLEGTHMDMTAGTMQPTGNPLDVAIEGAGFFQIQTPRGIRYTRNGAFQVSSTGVLVTAAGDPVYGDPTLAPRGLINVPVGKVSIASDGTVSVNGAVAGTIRLAIFDPGTKLTAEGDTLLTAPDGSARPDPKPSLRQGALETSNVNSIGAIVQLIGVQRQAEMMSRAMSIFDTEFNQIASTQLAKV